MRRPEEVILGNKRLANVCQIFTVRPDKRFERDESKVDALAIHHDATVMVAGDLDYNGSTLDEDMDRIEAVWDYHSLTKGWGRIGYHGMVSPNGRAFLTLPPQWVGAHIHGRNRITDGLCFMGYLSRLPPTKQAICAMGVLIAAFWRYRGGFPNISGHRGFPNQSTECPGNTAPDWWGKMIEAAVYHLNHELVDL